MRYAIVTFGCRVNQADSLALEGRLREQGGHGATPEAADLVLVNTCAVTACAEQRARQAIRRIARLNPAARIVATGCYATRRPDELASLPGVDGVWPNAEKDRVLGGARDAARSPVPASEVDVEAGPGPGPVAPGTQGRTILLLRVQTGCGERCSYCVVPATRGAPRSLAPAKVRAAVARAAAAGYEEIFLTGVHLGAYGRDLSPPSTLASLVRDLAETPGGTVFRIGSLEPMDCTAEILDLVAQSRRFAPHVHLPVQHGSDRVLTRMRRPYTAAACRRLVESVRNRLPEGAIGADVIVGFPGEDEDDFGRTLALVESSPLTYLHVFPYSDRPGTDAAGLGPKVDGGVIRERAARMREVGAGLAARFLATQVGCVRPGLTLEDGTLVVTDNYLKLRIPAGLERNRRVAVRVLGGRPARGAVLVQAVGKRVVGSGKLEAGS